MSSQAVRYAVEPIGGHDAMLATWDFGIHGGSFGEAEADGFVAATNAAIEQRLPFVSVLRTGGTRLTEGMRALVGIPRTSLALQALRDAGLPHISVADNPTMGGVWVSVSSRADIRIAVAGARIGFSGPRAVAAMTGAALADNANTAEAMYYAGLVDLLVDPDEVTATLGQVLTALRPDDPAAPPAAGSVAAAPPSRGAWEQVVASRTQPRPSGRELIEALLRDRIPLHGADETVVATVGRLSGRRVVGVALAADRSTMPTSEGFRLVARAAALADSLDLSLICFVDTPGADPHLEATGLAAAIGDAMTAVLAVRSPTVCLVHGEGGSGGALAAAVTDVVGVGPCSWFAALGPEGAAATLRVEPPEAARVMRITPTDLLSGGFSDAYIPPGMEMQWLVASLDRLRDSAADRRVRNRRKRWVSPLPNR
jgi:acetyl-CoA carboxylase alpha subunit